MPPNFLHDPARFLHAIKRCIYAHVPAHGMCNYHSFTQHGTARRGPVKIHVYYVQLMLGSMGTIIDVILPCINPDRVLDRLNDAHRNALHMQDC